MNRFLHRLTGLMLLLGTLGVAWGQGTLTNGWSHPGAIASSAQQDTWTLTAAIGDRLVFQVAELSGGAGFTPRIELRAPDGRLLMGDQDGAVARLDAQAGVAGDYVVGVRDANGTGTGTYTVQAVQVPGVLEVPAGDEGGPLTNGGNHDGAITIGDLDLWTIAATRGDRIIVQLGEQSGGAGFNPMIEAFDPAGRRLGLDLGGSAARLDLQAAATGTWSILVRDQNRNGVGTYRLHVALVPGVTEVPAGDEGGSLTDLTDHDGTILLGDLDVWTFSGSPGDLVTLQLSELTGGAGFAPRMELFGPDGRAKALAQGGAGATNQTVIDLAGTHTVVVSDSVETGSGTYRLRLTRSAIAPLGDNVLTNGASQLGSITAAGETNAWRFGASAGDSIAVYVGELATTPFLPWLRLYGPSGALVAEDYNAAAAEVYYRATNSGTFVVSVADGTTARNQTGDYRISLAKTGSPLSTSASDEGGALTNGSSYTAAIETGDVDAWTFTANAGETFVVWTGETTAGANLLPWLRVFGPDGAVLPSDYNAAAAQVVVRATNSGAFLVVVSDGNNGRFGTGNYRLSMAQTGCPLTITASDEGGALTNGASYTAAIDVGDADAWTFIANAGESFVAWIGETTPGSPLLPWLRVFGPDGSLLGNDFNAAAAQVAVRATNSGPFLVVVADGNNGVFGSGNYRLSLAKTGSPLAISPTDEGGTLTNGTSYTAAIEVGDMDAWTFDAHAGDSFVVWTGETTASSPLLPWLRVFGPDGVLLGNDFNAAAAEVTVRATNNGAFLVVVADGNNGVFGSGNYRLSLAKTGSPLRISASDEGGPLLNGATYLATLDVGDVDPWTFTAEAGDNIVLRIGEDGPGTLLPWLRIFGPDGREVGEDFRAAAAEVAFKATNSGPFTVIVGDGNNGRGGSGNYRLNLALMPEQFIVSATDDGGPLLQEGARTGEILAGDLDVWMFEADLGNRITIRVTEVIDHGGFAPWMRVYDANGVLLGSPFGTTQAELTLTTTASCLYQVVIGDGSASRAATGTYELTVEGLPEQRKQLRYHQNTPDTLLMCWSSELAGHVLQENPVAELEGWTDSDQPVADNGWVKMVNIPIGPDNRFFRLRPPTP